MIRQHLGATFFALKLRIHLVLWHARLQAVASVKLRAGIYIRWCLASCKDAEQNDASGHDSNSCKIVYFAIKIVRLGCEKKKKNGNSMDLLYFYGLRRHGIN